ncbi:NAD(P)-binding protein [Schizophyllum commune Tattone D]|nr:NAD(P)-binding protein [Schizophyllum commune Loenen D]KAI5834774.1 NAD(P)-binding protein [Schizophyllum commune Tattone D]
MFTSLLGVGCEYFPPKPKFTPNEIPDLTGKVFFVTGGNEGIGKETIQALLQHNATVYMATRTAERAQQAIEELQRATGRAPIYIHLNLGDLKTIQPAVEEFLSKESRLDVLINNAGVMIPPKEELTKDGYDLTFGTNVLGHFLLTRLLLPILQKTGSQGNSARIVTMTSVVRLVGILDFATMVPGKARDATSDWVLYFQSKLADEILALELARRYGEKGIVSIGTAPGTLMTDLWLQQKRKSPLQYKFSQMRLKPPHLGALTPLYAATMPEAKGFNGKTMRPYGIVAGDNPLATDPALGRDLWDWCDEQLVKVFGEMTEVKTP